MKRMFAWVMMCLMSLTAMLPAFYALPRQEDTPSVVQVESQETENEVEIDDVRFDFDPMRVKEGIYDVTFVTEGRTYKIHTTEYQKEGDIVSIEVDPEDIHVMRKSIAHEEL